jgi:hypothetical protein
MMLLGKGEASCSRSSDVKAGKEYAWSRGLGIEHSPIKTRSARKKSTLDSSIVLYHTLPPKVGPLEH